MNHSGKLDWLLDDLVQRVPQVSKAVILSRDGLPIGASATLSEDDAGHLAAVAAGLQSLARGCGTHFGAGDPRQTIVELDSAFLFVTDAGEGSCLAVLANTGADAGLIAYEMTVLVKRVGQHLGVAPRMAIRPQSAASERKWPGFARPASRPAQPAYRMS